VKEGNSAGVTYERLNDVYDYEDVCMDASSVRRWVKYFKDGNTDIADQPRCGRPRTAATGRLFGRKRETINAARYVQTFNKFVVRFVKNVRRIKLSSFNMTT
jgi:plasmid stabilization system protein ParE